MRPFASYIHVLIVALVITQISLLVRADGNKAVQADAAEGGYYVLIASMESNVIAALNLSSGEVKILHAFKASEGPRGIAVDQSGKLYASLRYGGQNVVSLSAKEGKEGFVVEDFTGLIGRFGPGKLRMRGVDELLIAGGTMGVIYRYDVQSGRETTPIAAKDMSIVVGLDVVGDEAYVIEVFERKLAKFELAERSARAFWLSAKAEPSLKRSMGLAVGHHANVLVANTQKSTISEFSSETGKHTGVFFDMKTVGLSSASDIHYVPAMKSYFVAAGGAVFRIDTAGKLIRKYPLGDKVKGGSAIVVVDKEQLAKVLAAKL